MVELSGVAGTFLDKFFQGQGGSGERALQLCDQATASRVSDYLQSSWNTESFQTQLAEIRNNMPRRPGRGFEDEVAGNREGNEAHLWNRRQCKSSNLATALLQDLEKVNLESREIDYIVDTLTVLEQQKI